MSCDGLYLISLKDRKPQRLPSGKPPFLVMSRLSTSPAMGEEPNQTGNTGWKSLAMQSILLGEVDDPRKRSGSRIRTAWTHDRDRQRQQHKVQKQGLGMGEDQTA